MIGPLLLILALILLSVYLGVRLPLPRRPADQPPAHEVAQVRRRLVEE